MTFCEEEKTYAEEIIAWRRRFHRVPEEGWTEFETTAAVIERLEALGFSVKTGTDVINPDAVMGRNPTLVEEAQQRARAAGVSDALLKRMQGYTGCVGEIDTGRPGKTVGFRFEMDCVVTGETTSPEHPPVREGFASTRPGLMHACGHDGHTAVGLGLAHWIADHLGELSGRFVLLFQPAEEGVRGAGAMAASGIADRLDYLFAAHAGCEFGPGEVGVLTHGFLATTKLDVYYEGVSAHAGSDPEKGRSALACACQAVTSILGIPRHSEGSSRIAVGRLVAGEGRNVVPAHAYFQMEVRGATTKVNDYMREEAVRIAKGMAEVYGIRCRVEKAGEAAVFDCDEECVELLETAAKATPGVKRVTRFTTERGSEDCSLLAKRVREKGGKAGYFCFGCRHCGHHRPDFDIQDRVSLPEAFGIFVRTIGLLTERAKETKAEA